VLYPSEAKALVTPNVTRKHQTLDEKIAKRAAHLVAYQNEALARKYRARLDGIADERLKEAVAKGYHKLLTYKDEYEVARLHLETEAKAREVFDGEIKLTFHLAPPLISKEGADGRPMKRTFGEGMLRGFRLLARLKGLRGTAFDPFGRTEERRMERALIKEYEADMAEWLPKAAPEILEPLTALAELPLQIRGFGPVKQQNVAKAAKRREEILALLRAGGAPYAKAAE
jgi:indolepyruvate ferredoxin oxidoreductase